MGLIAHYPLNGNANDALGRYDGTASNVTWVDGKLGQAGSFNATSTSNVIIQNDIDLLPSYSVSAWFKAPIVPTGSRAIFGKDLFFILRLHTNSTINVYTRSPANSWQAAGFGVIPIDEWVHVTITYSANTLKGYVNGDLVATYTRETKDTAQGNIRIGQRDGTDFFLGEIDDVRIYDHALSKREIRDLYQGLVFHLEANPTAPKDKSLQNNTLVNNGAVYTEDVPVGKSGYEFGGSTININTPNFTLSSSQDFTVSYWFLTNRTESYSVIHNQTAFGSGRIRHTAATRISPEPTLVNINLSESFGVGEWHHFTFVRESGVAKVYKNGNLVGQANWSGSPIYNSVGGKPNNSSWDYSEDMLVNDARIYTEALSADEVKELYQQRASLDSQGNFYAHMINDTGVKQALRLNYTEWQNGQTGSIGSFEQNGSTTENFRVIDTDPWGKPTVVWEARPDATSGADGGWSSPYYPIDNTKMYRVSTWVKRNSNSNGRFYLGTNGGGSAVLNRTNLASNGNPYFWINETTFTPNEWVLVVGHIWPVGSGTGSAHEDSGRYTVSNGRIGDITLDFVFNTGTTSARHRSYLFYATDTTQRQQWCYPRMDLCDGTEPSIASLLAGFDSRNEDLFRSKSGGITGQSINAIVNGSYSEVGITNGLVAYYPLRTSTKDLSGNGYDGVATGAIPVGGGFDGRGAYSFDGVDDTILVPRLLYGVGETIMCWFTANEIQVSGEDWILSQYTSGVGRMIFNIQGVGRPEPKFRYFIGGNSVFTTTTIVPNTLYFVAATRDSLGNGKIYLNGVLEGSAMMNTQPLADTPFDINGGKGSGLFNGDISNVKIFNRALSPEEIAVEYKRTGVTKMTQHQGTTYIQGEFKEV